MSVTDLSAGYSFDNIVSEYLNPIYLIPTAIAMIAILIAEWRVFTKAGQPGWAILIPFYGTWVLYKVICGRGTAMFRLLIPFYNIYWAFKSMIKLAHAYGKGTGFGVGLIFLEPIFMCILGFGDAQYQGPQNM
ncbi:MAG: hypothetical protein II038_10865 [Lachnospiraceae bacterium]|nr:hypothetical protein [Lachnospiraceae bacterium]